MTGDASPRRRLARLADRPVAGCAAVALVLRVALVLHALATNPLVRTPQLDGQYYLRWASDIRAGDVAGNGGLVGGEPWFLNPLYAYVLAPFARLADPVPAIALFQAALGAATAALAAAAAARAFGRLGGWTAGLLTAFAAPLAQLDAHVAVAELAAFLTAGACFACSVAPAAVRQGRGHGPLAAGLWLGIGALARPVTAVAAPLVAWGFARRPGGGVRAGVVVVVAFAACAVPSCVRNRAVSGETAVWTAAGGINVHLGNNSEARRYRAMTSPHIRFDPVEMHEDARRFVHDRTGRAPTRGEVGAWFTSAAVDEAFEHPLESAAFYAHKARWFFGPAEVPSSASLSSDRQLSPWLALAAVPTWLVASLALAGAWAQRRNRDLLLGAGSIALAHWAVLTLVFPLSHYRAPAIPALAVLAAGAAVAVAAAWAEGRRRTAAAVVAVAAAASVAGALPPGPDPLLMRDEAVLAYLARDSGDLAGAERHALLAREAYLAQWGEESAVAWELIGEMRFRLGKFAEARDALDRSLALAPEEPFVRVLRSRAHEALGDRAAAERDARDVVERYGFLPDGHARLGEVLSRIPGREREAREALLRALEGGLEPDPDALRRTGLSR